jgi:AbrB family looped-hinge helix DNA binding protein
METTKLSSKGQVIIPKRLRSSYHWGVGQELTVIDAGEGVLLKPKKPFAETSLSDVAGCLKYKGAPKTLDDIGQAIKQGVKEWKNKRFYTSPELTRTTQWLYSLYVISRSVMGILRYWMIYPFR